jgi:hypothetical protein
LADQSSSKRVSGSGNNPARRLFAEIKAPCARRQGGGTGVEDKRRFPRFDVEEPAHVSFGGTSLSCMIRNISDEGAAIDVENASYIPERFRLVMTPSTEVRSCRLVWIKQNRIGVAFES